MEYKGDSLAIAAFVRCVSDENDGKSSACEAEV